MKKVQAFMSLPDMIRNEPNTVALLGELSPVAETYSRQRADYYDGSVPGYRLTTFESIDVTTGSYVTLDLTQVNQIMTITKSVIQYVRSNARTYDSSDFANTVIANNAGNIADLRYGQRVDNGVISLCEWISWTSPSGNYNIKIWLSDEAFKAQYENYTIVVVPPLSPLDHFFNFFSAVSTELDAVTAGVLDKHIELAGDEYPYTYLRLLSFDFVNVVNPTQKKSVLWPVLIYGAAGDNADSIKDAILDYILANSTHTKTEWEAIFPSIFKRTEFVLLPRFDKISIPNLTSMSALYGNFMEPAECVSFAKTACPFYPTSHVEANIFLMPFDFKALMIVTVAGTTNVDGKKKITDIYPDYIPVNTSALDFNRMTQPTRDWVYALSEMLIEAEKITPYSSVKRGMRRVTRNGKVFLSGLVNNVNYLVAVKYNDFYQG